MCNHLKFLTLFKRYYPFGSYPKYKSVKKLGSIFTPLIKKIVSLCYCCFKELERVVY